MSTSTRSRKHEGRNEASEPARRQRGWQASVHAVFTCILVVAMSVTLSGCALSPDPPDGGDALAREIEDADIIKLLDGYLYIANPYTGLRIVDARDVELPTMMGSVSLKGRGVQLFTRGDLAFVFTAADFFNCAGTPAGFDPSVVDNTVLPDFEGSRLWVIDISNKNSPKVANTFDFDGFVTASWRVGDVIYVSGNTRRFEDLLDQDLTVNDILTFDLSARTGAFVTAINIADADNVFQVETETFSGSALDVYIESDAMYVVGDDPTTDELTLVTYVDISDPQGDIVVRDQFRVPGEIENRFYVDEFDGAFRIITEEFIRSEWTRVVALYTYDVSDADDIRRLSRTPIITGESLRAVRFDGERGYAVTFVQHDPLFVIDLSNPANPQVTGELEVPGYSTHLVPLGDRLVGVGLDFDAGTRPAVALYDVADPTDPRQLARIVVGDRFTSGTDSSATVDHKALRVIEESGLILLPFSTFDSEQGLFTDALQFIEMEDATLRQRGTIDHRGFVRRADLLDQRIWVLSDQSFQTVNVDDLDSPTSLATLEFISDQELLDAGFWGCVAAARDEATQVSPMFRGGPCGMMGLIPFTLMFAGLGLFKLSARTRLRR